MLLDRQALLRRFGDIWPVHHRGFTALLIECRRHFDGDMDQLLILSVIGERHLSAERVRGLSYPEFLDGRRVAELPPPINTRSVADITGIPRETVRRKIGILIGRGWVERDDNGGLQVTEKAAADLAPATQATFDYLLGVYEALMRIAVETSESPADPPGAANEEE